MLFIMHVKGFYNRTPLHYACEKGHLPIVEYLISKGEIFSNENENNGNTNIFMLISLLSYKYKNYFDTVTSKPVHIQEIRYSTIGR